MALRRRPSASWANPLLRPPGAPRSSRPAAEHPSAAAFPPPSAPPQRQQHRRVRAHRCRQPPPQPLLRRRLATTADSSASPAAAVIDTLMAEPERVDRLFASIPQVRGRPTALCNGRAAAARSAISRSHQTPRSQRGV